MKTRRAHPLAEPSSGSHPRGAAFRTWALGLVACTLQALSAAWAAYPPPEVAAPPTVRTDQLRAWKDFNHEGHWRIRWNSLAGRPGRIAGYRLDLAQAVTRENVEQVTRTQPSNWRGLLRMDPQALVLSKADYHPPRQGRQTPRTWYVYSGQTYRGEPGAGLPLPDSGEAGAMAEAWAGYFSSAAAGDANLGESCHNWQKLDAADRRFPDDWVGDACADGAILSGALRDLRGLVGAQYADRLVLRAIRQATTTFAAFLAALLAEDDDPAYSSDPARADNDPADGTPNADSICHAFVDLHGIYDESCEGHTRGPIAVIRTPDPVGFNVPNSSSAHLTIEGAALGTAGDALASFAVEYSPPGSPGTWLSAGVTLTGTGLVAVSGGPLARIDLSGLGDGIYLIRLTVTTAGGVTASTTTSMVFERTLMPGWPQARDTHFYSSPAIADLDPTQSGLELVAAGGAELFVWHSDGTPAPGWPRSIGQSLASPAVADLDGDGALEVVIHTLTGAVYAFHGDGTPVAGWPQATGAGGERSTTALGDLDGDGNLEVVVGSRDGHVYAWHHDGAAVSGWPVAVSGEVEGSPAVGDIDGDGRPEIVVGASDGRVYAWRGNGTPVPGWPQKVPGSPVVSASPALGDLDGDGHLEVVVATADLSNSRDHKVYAWHYDGTLVNGWPRPIGAPTLAPASVGLADLDGDGSLEVLVMSNDDILHAWHGDGTPVTGWPSTASHIDTYEPAVSSPVVADIDGDGAMEVVAEGGYSTDGGFRHGDVFAFHFNGADVLGWPKAVPDWSNGSPAVADIDGDGDVEVVMASEGLFVWDLPVPFGSASMEWPLYRHDNRRTGTYGPKTGIVLLLDSSGSMSWSPGGVVPVPVSEQRLTQAKAAALPFLELLNDFGAGKADFGIATFPSHPSSLPSPCSGQVVSPMTLVTPTSAASAVRTSIPGLATQGSTPLLAGIRKAVWLFGTESNRALVLLSDGYDNCPALTTLGDVETEEVVRLLQRNSIRVFAIGFGLPTDLDYPLLEALADATTPPGYAGSQLYDVTQPGLDGAAWTPVTALQSAYGAVLADALDLQGAADFLGVIRGGETRSFPLHINEHDRRVAFFLSWRKPQRGRLGLALKSADGSDITSTTPGVQVHEGKTYLIVTADPSLLAQPGKVAPRPWLVEVRSPGLEKGESESFQYSVVLDSALRLRAGFDRASYGTGDTITLTARLTEAGRALTGLTDVEVVVGAPQDGRGNWLARNPVSPADLAQVPEQRGSELLAPFVRKGIYLADIRRTPFPGRKAPRTLRLFDDGTHGDAAADDGIYANRFTDSGTEGVYTFRFHATGLSADGNGFEREQQLQKRVAVKVSRRRTTVQVVPPSENSGLHTELVVIPRDSLGNYLGPGYGKTIQVVARGAELVGDLEDRLDGSYAQVVRVPAKGKATIAFDVLGVHLERSVAGADAGLRGWWPWLTAAAALGLLTVLALLRTRRPKPCA
jgi:FG-GAP-like repeat/von Willebrand factor type A domain